MPTARTRIIHQPLSERVQKAKDDRVVFEPGDEVPQDIADQVPGAIATSSVGARGRDVTSDAAIRRSITHAPDHPDRPLNIPGEHEWKVSKSGAFAGTPVSTPADTAAARAVLRRDTPAPAVKAAPFVRQPVVRPAAPIAPKPAVKT